MLIPALGCFSMSADHVVLLQFNVLNARNRPDRPIDESKMLALCKQIEEIWYKKCDSMVCYQQFLPFFHSRGMVLFLLI